jgi:hypothetical protein
MPLRMQRSSEFFLFIGNATPEAAVSKLKASGIYYAHKKLESSPLNWQATITLVEDPALIGVVVKLTGSNYEQILYESYRDVAGRLLVALSTVRHIVFVHETVLSSAEHAPDSSADDDYGYEEERYYFSDLADDIRVAVNELFEQHGMNVVPYKTNAELSVLSASFIEDNEKNLLFRLYVPHGRIYAAEADKLLSMFRDWLTQVKRQRVRQDGYRTGSGQVYEFFGDDATTSSELTAQFDDFSRFLDLCVDHPDEARDQLTATGVDRLVAEDIVRRYGKETRRLHLDLRHAREARLLSIRQRLESELVDVFEGGSEEWVEINRMTEALVPGASDLVAALTPASAGSMSVGQTQVTINQQIIQSVEGTVVQGVQGTLDLDPEAKELLDLVGRFGGADAAALESAVHELEDADARQAGRLRAKQRLKGFLFKLGGKVEDTALVALQRYVESKLGL